MPKYIAAEETDISDLSTFTASHDLGVKVMPARPV